MKGLQIFLSTFPSHIKGIYKNFWFIIFNYGKQINHENFLHWTVSENKAILQVPILNKMKFTERELLFRYWEQCLKISSLYNENCDSNMHLKFLRHPHNDDSVLS